MGCRYCSANCQRAAWKLHKQSCNPPAAAAPSGPEDMPAILLGIGLQADKVLIQKPPFGIANVRHHFTNHRRSKDSDFITMSMPLFKRVFQRDIHIIFDRSMMPGGSTPSSYKENNTFGTRSASALSTGLGPPIRGQALMFDPTGAPFHVGDFMAYDNLVFNLIMDKYSDNWTERPPTEAELDRLSQVCMRRYEHERLSYNDEGKYRGYNGAHV